MGRVKGERDIEGYEQRGARESKTESRAGASQTVLPGRGQLISCLPPFIPLPASPSLCGRVRKTKPGRGGRGRRGGKALVLKCEHWRLLVEVGFVTLFLHKSHLALGELPGSVLGSYCCLHVYAYYAYAHMLRRGPARILAYTCAVHT